jgi:hypothetical protein
VVDAVVGGVAGVVRPVRAMLHHYYDRRLHLDDRYIAWMARAVAPEGGGDHGSTRGGYDQLGLGTLMYAEQPSPRPVHRNTGRPCGALVIPVHERGEGLVGR